MVTKSMLAEGAIRVHTCMENYQRGEEQAGRHLG